MASLVSVQEALRVEQVRSRRREQLLEGENEVLKLIVERAPLPSVLEALVLVAERQSTAGLLGSILLLDSDGVHMRHGAAPSLPSAYSKAIDGLPIGPKCGSCGTAAYLRKPVVVSDIETDPLWSDFRSIAGEHGLRACWSSPIFSARGVVLGTFALYYRSPCSPDAEDESMISILTRTAALAIEHSHAESELAQSEERFRSLTRCAPMGVFTTDAAGAFVYVNPRFLDTSAFDYEKTFDYWLENATQNRCPGERWRNAVSLRVEYAEEFQISQNGRFVSVRAAPIKSRTGEYLGYVGTVEDISGRVFADSELRREANLRKAIEESIPVGIAVFAVDGTQSYVNRAFAEMTGWSAEELTGEKPPFVYWAENQLRATQNAFRTMLDGGAPQDGFELQLQRKNGECFDAFVTVAPLQGHGAEISGWVASVMDITDRKKSERAHLQSETRLSLALQAGRMGAWEWDIVKGSVSWSPELEAIHGIPTGSFGGTFADFQYDMNPGHRERVVNAITDAVRRKADYQVEYEIIRPDDSHAWVEARGRVLCNSAGEPVRMVGVCMDVSDRHSHGPLRSEHAAIQPRTGA